MPTLLLVDDHEVFRIGLRTVLEFEPDLRVVGEAGDAAAGVRAAEALRPDLVLMDVRLGGIDGVAACREIRSRLPEVRVLMLTSFADEDVVMASIMAGAAGFVTKNVGRAELLAAIRSVARGESLLDPAVTRSVLARLVELSERDRARGTDNLSEREREVLVLVAQGCTNREIAEKLVLSEHTARNHISRIFEKLGLSRRSEAAAYATRMGLTPPPRAESVG
jgi:two-component system, NarL family, response regulator DevR